MYLVNVITVVCVHYIAVHTMPNTHACVLYIKYNRIVLLETSRA